MVIKVIRSLFSFPRLAEGCACGYSFAAESEYVLDGRVECGIDPGGGEGCEGFHTTPEDARKYYDRIALKQIRLFITLLTANYAILLSV